MSVRVVARIRPLLKAEAEKDLILSIHEGKTVKIPNPKSQHEEYSFNFSAAYNALCSQQELFDAEGKIRGEAVHTHANTHLISRADHQAPLPRIRRYALRIRSHRQWQDTHDARRQIHGRSRHDPPAAKQYLQKE